MPQRVAADAVSPQAWRNGGGSTRELLCWPSADTWTVRISLADIDADGPFSAFAGVERWFVVVEGAGVALRFAEGRREVRAGDAPLRFDGSAAPGCSLLDGPTRDLNLMLRASRGVMQPVAPGVEWAAEFDLRALFTRVAGRWSGDGLSLNVPAATLLWSAAPPITGWRFEPADAPAAPVPGSSQARAWWLGASPNTVARYASRS